jgi:hypothetical protein
MRPRIYGKRKKVDVWLEYELLAEIDKLEDEGESRNHYIVRCIEYALKHSPLDFLDDDTKKRLWKEAHTHNQTVTTTMRQILEDYFKTQDERGKAENKNKEKYADFFNDLQTLAPGYYSFADLAKMASKYFLDDQTHRRMITQAVEKRIIKQVNSDSYSFQSYKLCSHYCDGNCKIKLVNKGLGNECEKQEPQTCWIIQLLREAKARGETQPALEREK